MYEMNEFPLLLFAEYPLFFLFSIILHYLIAFDFGWLIIKDYKTHHVSQEAVCKLVTLVAYSFSSAVLWGENHKNLCISNSKLMALKFTTGITQEIVEEILQICNELEVGFRVGQEDVHIGKLE